MDLKTSRLQIDDTDTGSLVTRPITPDRSVVEGAFYQVKPVTLREVITRKVNKSLSCVLLMAIVITFVSYYVTMNYETKLNNLDNEIVRLNAENQDLQADLDRLKSFNNVDNRIGKFNLLQKADKVIEVTALDVDKQKNAVEPVKTVPNNFNLAIGY